MAGEEGRDVWQEYALVSAGSVMGRRGTVVGWQGLAEVKAGAKPEWVKSLKR
jgi:hypothetical protein